MAITKIPSKKYRYTYQVDLRYKDIHGVTQRYIKSGFRKKTDAKQHEATILEKVSNNISIIQSHKKTFDDVFQEYMEVEGKTKYAPATFVYYMDIYNAYIDVKFKKLNIDLINYAVMQRYINNLSKTSNYPVLKNVKKVFSITMKYAMRNNYISHNPVEELLLPDKPDKNMNPTTISDEDFNKIIDEILNYKQSRYRKMNVEFTRQSYAMALIIGRYTGLRISEVLALKKSDFDLVNKQLTVQRRVEYAGLKRDEIYLTDILKTKSSKTRIEISMKVISYLEKWFKYNPFELVICDSSGNLINPPTFQDRINRTSRKLGINFHYHMLRHTYATELMMNGVNPMVVKKFLRHGDVNTTWNVYTHPITDHQHKELDEIYSKEKEKLKFEIDFNMKCSY